MMPSFMPYFRLRYFSLAWMIPASLAIAIAFAATPLSATAQTPTKGN